MSPGLWKSIGIGCFVACLILFFVAWDRYRDNANKVEAMNKMIKGTPLGGMMDQLKSSPIGGMMGGADAKLEPGMPDSTKYALGFAVLTAAGGIVCMVMSAKATLGIPAQSTPPPIP
jgi:hypothetical protein